MRAQGQRRIFDGIADNELQAPQAQTVPIRGWKVMTNMRPVADLMAARRSLPAASLSMSISFPPFWSVI